MVEIDLERFIDIQDEGGNYETALQEIRDGRKLSHWIWYVFPQIRGLGHSSMSEKYGISSLLEAKAYWENWYPSVLHDRLKEITEALLAHRGKAIESIFGWLDAMKVKSCMTLFDVVSPCDVFQKVLDTFYDGERCEATLSLVKPELDYYKDDSAFERNGMEWVNTKGFFEGSSHEANYYEPRTVTATLFDLVLRGDSMQDMTAYYLWHRDLMPYRVSDVEIYLISKVQNFAIDMLNGIKDAEAQRLLCRLYNKGEGVNGVFAAAKYFDEALDAVLQNAVTREAVSNYVKAHSRAKPKD